MLDMSDDRRQMVERQIAGRGVADDRVLEAMRQVPREAFVPEALQEFAYEDTPLPIEAGQTISQPFIVGLMIAAAEIGPDDHVLEIGAGSGYAAAVMSRIAREVWTIERHAELTESARERFEALGYDNIHIRTSDGTRGWPEAAPFDAIIAAAGGPMVPPALRDQLAVGGRLVMPVGDQPRQQTLVKLTRTGENAFEQEDLGPVLFVPMIGEQGWSEADDDRALRPAEPRSFRERTGEPTIPDLIASAAEALPEIDDDAFGALFDRFAEAKVVLLGESTHGTAEFYRARAAITRRLVEAHGFTIVAVEADWPDAAAIDRYVRHRPARAGAEPPFTRFPTWMWRNTEVEAFSDWLRARNARLPPDRQAGFYGLDLYSLGASMRAVIDYLDRVDPEAAIVARERYGCLTPWGKEPQAYGRMAVSSGYARCEAPVTAMLRDLLERRLDYAAHDGETLLDATENARLVQNAEAYYRALYFGAAESWNLRDQHMFETLTNVLASRGEDAKAVVWAHNSHIGDATFTEMGVVRGELNLGQLCRERFGKAACLIGFGAHGGTVAAAGDWDAPMEVMAMTPSLPDSYERLAHDSRVPRFLLDLRQGQHDGLRHRLLRPRQERFIGVIYRPRTERLSHYMECSLPRQFDAYVWFDQTTAVTPLAGPTREGEEETYPFGL